MIIVTGANGQLGGAIVAQLLARMPANQIGVSVVDPAKATAFTEQGIRVRRGDFTDPASLAEAFEGASQVLVVSTDATGERAVRMHTEAIEAAAKAGARRILYTSHMGARPDSPFPPMPDHAATEAVLQHCGVAFTSLRNGFYAASALQLLDRGLKSGEIYAPEDGKVAWTTHADLAEAAAIALGGESGLDGLTPPLTAGEAFDFDDLAAIASEITGRQIKRIVVADARWRETLVSHGAPEAQADLLVGIFQASRRGDFATVDPTLERLLGRPPQTMRDVLAATLKP
ncbi:NAD(P)H-binding protein [Propylenella binzhouense]|uniref:NAD-dependent epimerase/dehydratase family protein n=1 Tax=Propylenella binzhouense TaxID=2555902 RepID=A0A964WSJ8_9HYPH|nr:NAD(P)H-binding protein [Propylenella binzhouense]MYZ46880.1 NAD-dependent epimerase/dehydratase family protein [Propylenella binzhouense]